MRQYFSHIFLSRVLTHVSPFLWRSKQENYSKIVYQILSFFRRLVSTWSVHLTPSPHLLTSLAQRTNSRSLYPQNLPPIQTPSKTHALCDRAKDQKYYLSSISESGLYMALFPLTDLSKSQVREIALVGISTVPHARRVWDYSLPASSAILMVYLSSRFDRISEASHSCLLTGYNVTSSRFSRTLGWVLDNRSGLNKVRGSTARKLLRSQSSQEHHILCHAS